MNTRMTLTIDVDMKKQATEYAKSIGLSLAGLMRMTLSEKLKKNNYLVRDNILADTENLEKVSYDDLIAEINDLKC